MSSVLLREMGIGTALSMVLVSLLLHPSVPGSGKLNVTRTSLGFLVQTEVYTWRLLCGSLTSLRATEMPGAVFMTCINQST